MENKCILITAFVLSLTLSSCTSLLTSRFIEPTVANLQKQSDLDLVCEGSPSYLLMIDSMIAGKPENSGLLNSGVQAYVGYINVMEECGYDSLRIKNVSEKAKLYGKRLLEKEIGDMSDRENLDKQLAAAQKDNAEALFWGALGWLTWIQFQEGSPLSMIELPVVEKIMTRVLELDETIQAGSPHLFFGGYYATRPPMFGGDPDKSRYHFERALEISGRNFLLIQTTIAATLARQLFDQELHDALLEEVIAFPLDKAPEYTLSNQVAKRRAQNLLNENYFGD